MLIWRFKVKLPGSATYSVWFKLLMLPLLIEDLTKFTIKIA